MKKFCFILMTLLLFTSCSGKINTSFPQSAPVKQDEKLRIDVFSLAFHKQLGSCSSLPITHRVLVFRHIPLATNGDDFYIGSLMVLVDNNTGTYEALYNEVPAENNTDHSFFQTRLAGSFEIIKNSAENDKMILNNIGVITPTITGSSVQFFIKLETDINKEIIQKEVLGEVRFVTTPILADNCLL